MIRKIIKIDQDLCNGCGKCVIACHEQAIQLIDGKAQLIRDDYCDGLGDCLPSCPTNAISFETREALAYDEEAVAQNLKQNSSSCCSSLGCPSSKPQGFKPQVQPEAQVLTSQLRQWPVQIKLAPLQASYYQQAHLLIAADCAAYAYANFHHKFMKNKVTLIGCPKLDQVDYSEKLAAIIANNDIKSLTIVRMEVPCCKGLEIACQKALQQANKFIPWQIVVLSAQGEIITD